MTKFLESLQVVPDNLSFLIQLKSLLEDCYEEGSWLPELPVDTHLTSILENVLEALETLLCTDELE